MAFDMVSQMQGPVIPINLYSDNATAGINAGNAMPTPLTSAIQGAIKGYSQGQQIVAQGQENEIRANQIEQLPVANEIQRQELKAKTQQNDINQISHDVLMQNQDLVRDTKLAELTKAKADSTRQLDDAEATNQLMADIQSGDPVKMRVFDNQRYAGLMVEKPALAKAAVGIYDRYSLWKPGTQERVETVKSLDAIADRNYQLELKKVDAAARSRRLTEEAAVSGKFLDTFPDTVVSVPESKVHSSYEMYPSGMYPMGADGKIHPESPDFPAVAPDAINPSDKGRYTLYKAGKIVRDGFSSAQYELWNKHKRLSTDVDDIIREQTGTTAADKAATNPTPKQLAAPVAGFDSPTAAPAPAPAPAPVGNQTIVDQQLKKFNAKASGDLTERLAAKAAAIRGSVSQMKQQAESDMGFDIPDYSIRVEQGASGPSVTTGPGVERGGSAVGGGGGGGGEQYSDMSEQFNTQLTPEEETQFQQWRSTLPKRLQDVSSYDLRGYWKEHPEAKIASSDQVTHMTDKYKKPNHPTFSIESKYNGAKLPSGTKAQGGSWKGDTFVPPSPEASAFSLFKKPVSFNFDTSSATNVSPEALSNVFTDPLLAKEPSIIKGLAITESGASRKAMNPGLFKRGAKDVPLGLFQVKPSTAADYGLNASIPEENLQAAKLYLFDQMVRYDGNAHLALAAYNAGQGTISDAIREAGSTDWEDVKAVLRDRLSPARFKEVSAYPDKVLTAATQVAGMQKSPDKAFMAILRNNNLVTV